ncbi:MULTISPECIES: hypothetical protein [unclassified Endozoicomonas]|uniref:hypothetical protein n=1 Tax=unclassified Endozoicomonas TaxID=2644528 RepID=UPI003BB76B6A
MDLSSFLGQTTLSTLSQLKLAFPVIDYSVVEGDEFIKLQEHGCFFYSENSSGVISGYRVYFVSYDDYDIVDTSFEYPLKGLITIDDVSRHLGNPNMDIPSIKIPGLEATLPGFRFSDQNLNYFVHLIDEKYISYINYERKLPLPTMSD